MEVTTDMTVVIMTVVMTLATIVIAVATSLYAVYSRKLIGRVQQQVDVQLKELRNQQMPVLVFRWRKGPKDVADQTTVYHYRLVNVGSGPAIITGFDSGNLLDLLKQKNTPGGTDYDIAEPDNIIGTGTGDHELEVCFGWERAGSREPILRNPSAGCSVTYKDIFGREFRTKYANLRNDFVPPCDIHP